MNPKSSFLLLIFLFIVSLKFPLILNSRCGSDKLKANPLLVSVPQKKRNLDSSNYQPIRIYFDETYLLRQKSTYDASVVEGVSNVLSEIANIYKSLLSVIPGEKLKIRTTVAQIKFHCGGNKYINEAIVGEGLDYDIVIYPSLDNSLGSGVLAGATHCLIDDNTYRPIGGYVLINPEIDFSQKNANIYLKYLLLHEIAHILGFSPDLWQYFPIRNPISYKTINGINRAFLQTPKVLEKAKIHFGCSNMNGVELENQGGEGSAGSHWEARIMLGDLMISTNYPEIVISDITLALFEDSGWYKVNYYTGGLFRFGKGQGCTFLEQKCIQSEKTPFSQEFCLTSQGPRCGNARINFGFCYLTTFTSNIPSAYQYFSNPKTGGFQPADYCPVFYDSTSVNSYFLTHVSYGNSQYANAPGLGETIGNNSICLLSKLRPNEYLNDLATYTNIRAISHEIECDKTNRRIIIKILSHYVYCPTEGGVITADGFDGTIECPDYNSVCTSDIFCNDIVDCLDKKQIASESSYTYDYSRGATYQDSETSDSDSVFETNIRDGANDSYANSFYIKNKHFIKVIPILLTFLLYN